MRSLGSSSAADLGSGDTSQHPWPRHGGSQVYSSATDHQFLRAPESFRRAGGGGAEIVSEKCAPGLEGFSARIGFARRTATRNSKVVAKL